MLDAVYDPKDDFHYSAKAYGSKCPEKVERETILKSWSDSFCFSPLHKESSCKAKAHNEQDDDNGGNDPSGFLFIISHISFLFSYILRIF